MTEIYIPKPGDRVTSPLLVGEWEVQNRDPISGGQWLVQQTSIADRISISASHLTPVAPPLPPEPPVGSVVRAHGRLWQQWERWGAPGAMSRDWSNLADAPDLSPVVAVEDVAEWLEERVTEKNPDGRQPTWLQRAFRDEFGGWRCECSAKGPCYDHR